MFSTYFEASLLLIYTLKIVKIFLPYLLTIKIYLSILIQVKVATNHSHNTGDETMTRTERIEQFLKTRFGFVTEEYRNEWLKRFDNGTAWNMADSKTREMMEEMDLHHNQMQTK